MTSSMRAARFAGDGMVALEEVAVPTPGQDELLVRVDSCALCGTDRAGWSRGSDVIPGHETSGTVAALGSDVVADVEPGTRGVVYLVAACGHCAACRKGGRNACQRKDAAYGFTAPGGFAEYLVVRSDCFLPIDDAIPLDLATGLLDLFGTTSHAFARACRPDAGTVVVIGCGPIGLGAIAVARGLQIPVVVGIDLSPYRLSLASRLGAVPVDAWSVPPVDVVRDLVPDGFDIVIEAAGRASTQRMAIEMSGPSGVVVIVAHSEETLEIQTSPDLIAIERTILGSEYFPPGEFADVHEAVRIGRLDPAPVLTHRFPLDRIDEACRVFFGGDTGKVVVRP
jgi:threonine 3-dehydrogenase